MFNTKFCLVLIHLSLLINSVACAGEVQKIALLVGINDYNNFGQNDGDLSGCINDVKFISQILINKYGFSKENIKILLDGEASAENIEKAFQEHIISKAKPGDIVVFHFSGHGTYLDDDNRDEMDGLDEALCAADCDVSSPDTGYIRDDLLGSLIDKVATDDITVILDCCHSGTGTRDLVNCKDRKYVPPFMTGKTGTREICSKEGGMKGVVITGCTAAQISADAYFDVTSKSEGIWMGALSKNIYNTLLFAPPGMTYEELIAMVQQRLASQGFDQNPQLEGSFKNKSVFNIPSGEVKMGIPINSVENNMVEIELGCMGGAVTVGSIYEVYPPGTDDFSGNGTGKIEIVETSVMKSVGKLVEGQAETEGKAVEIAKTYTDNIINLAILDDGLRSRVEKDLKSLGFVNIVGQGEPFDRIFKEKKDDNSRLTLLYPDGRTIVEVDSSSDAGNIVNKIAPYLENAYVIKNLAELNNPSPDFNVEVWTDKNSTISYIGDTVTFKFKTDRDCYITLIDVGTDGTVTILFPNYVCKDNRVTAEQVYSIPSPEMGFNIRVAGPAGQEMVKAIATLEPLDITQLEATGANFKGIDGPVQYIQDIPFLLSKGLALEGTSQEENSTLDCSGWATGSIILTVTHK